MSDRPDIIIADFLKYNSYALEELKATNPDVDKAVSDVIKAVFQKYTGTSTEETEPTTNKEGESPIYYKIIWSEKTSQENMRCDSLEDIQERMEVLGMTGNSKTYVKTKIGVYDKEEEELDTFRVDVGLSKGDYNYEEYDLQTYLSIHKPEQLKELQLLSGMIFSLSQRFYDNFKARPVQVGRHLVMSRKGVDIGKLTIKSIDVAKSFGPNCYSKYKDMYTYKVAYEPIKSANLYRLNTMAVMSFNETQIRALLDGQQIMVPDNQTALFKEITYPTWKSFKECMIASVGGKKAAPKKSPPKKSTSNTLSIYPPDIPSVAKNTGNRTGPTQSASDYIKQIEEFNNEWWWDIKDGQKAKDAKFYVQGNDERYYTITMDKNGTARWVIADVKQIEQNNLNAETGYEEENLSSMSVTALKNLLKDKKEALSVFEPSEPEYVNLEIEIDDIEEELDNRN